MPREAATVNVAADKPENKDKNPDSSPLSFPSEQDQLPLTPLRPQRIRKKPRRLSSEAAHDDKAIPERPKKTLTKRTPKKIKWTAERLLTDVKSPLATSNLRSILSNPIAWDALNPEERKEILSLFPDQEHIIDMGTENARPNFESLLNDDSFRHDCAAYTENIALGRHDPDWLASAWAAHERRKIGGFDGYLLDKLEREWGVEIPEEMKVRRQQAGKKVAGDRDVKPDKSGEGQIMDTIRVDDIGTLEDTMLEPTQEPKMDVDTE